MSSNQSPWLPLTPDAQKVYTTQSAAKVLGVSVPTVQQLVESGQITAWKTAGGHRRIPALALHQYIHRQTRPMPVAGNHAPSAGPVRLFILEDDELMQTAYRSKLRQWSLPLVPVFCDNGYDALLEIALRLPDIIVLDMVMPGIDGFEVLRAITQKPDFAHAHLAVVSNLPKTELQARGGLPDGISYFLKPLNFDEFRGYLGACCAAAQRRHSAQAPAITPVVSSS